jgi:two-component system, OmpR family, sensor histidine kinase QseC
MSPNRSERESQPLLRRYLLRWALGAVLLVWLTLLAVAWNTGLRESRKFSDGQLVSVTRLWLQTAPTAGVSGIPLPLQGMDHEYLQDVAVLAWEDGRLVGDSHRLAPGLDLASLPTGGFATVRHQDAQGNSTERRVFAASLYIDGHDRRVLALMDMKKRSELGKDIAEHLAQPALLIFPLVALLLWWAIRRGLRPLDQLSHEVAALDGFAGQRLDTQHRFREFKSTVSAINALVDTLQQRAQRERAFASDVAHELRTPLAAIALQASAAQHEASPDRLQRLEQEALRAGRILSQLLDLARAQRADGAPSPDLMHAGSEVDLVDVARRLVADHAPSAYESGHEIALTEAKAPVLRRLQPLQLELALRNLIENALRHTPSGTQIEVSVWRAPSGELGISVSDDGGRALPHTVPDTARAVSADGLGLGLRLVERLAEQMGAVFERDTGEPPMTTRFTLRWSP